MESLDTIISNNTDWDSSRLKKFAQNNKVYYREYNGLIILNYMDDIHNHNWNDFNKQSRGVILDLAKKQIIAHPFDKFFNINAHPDTMLDVLPLALGYSIAHKYDGSMITAFKHNNAVHFATRMSFQNPQTDLAQQVYQQSYPQLSTVPLEDFTLIFELVAPENQIIVNYAQADLILIGVRDLKHNLLLAYDEVIKFAKKYQLQAVELINTPFESLYEIAHHGNSEMMEEGWVIAFNNGLFVKLKTWQYLAQVHIKRLGLTTKQLFKSYCDMDTEQWLNFINKLPVETQDVVQNYGHFIQAKIDHVILTAKQLYTKYQHIDSQKDFAMLVQTECSPEYGSLVFLLRKNKSPESYIKKFPEKFLTDEQTEEVVQPIMIKEWAWQMLD